MQNTHCPHREKEFYMVCHLLSESACEVPGNLQETEDRSDNRISEEYLYATHPGFDDYNTISPRPSVDTLM